MRQMRSGTVAKLERFWNALIAAAHGPLRKADYPFMLAKRCGIKYQAALKFIEFLRGAGYIMPMHAQDERGSPLIAVHLKKEKFSVGDFSVSKKTTRKPKSIAAPTPMSAPMPAAVKTFRQRVAIFLDLDNLCIGLLKRGMILGISDILRKAAEEGIVIACFGFIQRKTFERLPWVIDSFPRPPKMFPVVSSDYSQASDQTMLCMIQRFADSDLFDTAFIGTADTQLFEAAQRAVRRVGKNAALLDCCELSFTIRAEASRIMPMRDAAILLRKHGS